MAVVYLTGVLEDGSTPAPDVPANPRELLAVTQGTTTQVFVRCVTRGGVPLEGGPSMILRVKQQPGDEPALAQVTGTYSPLSGPGVWVFTFTPTMFQGVQWGRYLYDVTRSDINEGTNRLIQASPFLLRPAI